MIKSLVVDTNILIGALSQDSLIRNLILRDMFDLYSLFLSQQEVKKYLPLLMERTGIPKDQLETTLALIYSHITLMDEKMLDQTLSEARTVMDSIDPGDTPFLALTLALPVDGIWSDDKHFQKQRRVKVWTTAALLQELLSGNT